MATNEGRRPVPRAIIEVRNLRKEYPVEDETVVALDRVNLSIPQGQICCIFGESGSGKSTLLNQLAGMEKPTRGGVRIGGVPVSKLDERELAAFRQKHLGFVFQDFNLLDSFNLKDNILLPLVLSRMDVNEMERRLSPIAKMLGIEELLTKFPYEVSGGEKQRAAVARAIITDPRILLADEPTGALDSKSSKRLLDNFAQLNSQGKTILMVTHSAFAATAASSARYIARRRATPRFSTA